MCWAPSRSTSGLAAPSLRCAFPLRLLAFMAARQRCRLLSVFVDSDWVAHQQHVGTVIHAGAQGIMGAGMPGRLHPVPFLNSRTGGMTVGMAMLLHTSSLSHGRQDHLLCALQAAAMREALGIHTTGFGFGLPSDGIHGPNERYGILAALLKMLQSLRVLLPQLALYAVSVTGSTVVC